MLSVSVPDSCESLIFYLTNIANKKDAKKWHWAHKLQAFSKSFPSSLSHPAILPSLPRSLAQHGGKYKTNADIISSAKQCYTCLLNTCGFRPRISMPFDSLAKETYDNWNDIGLVYTRNKYGRVSSPPGYGLKDKYDCPTGFEKSPFKGKGCIPHCEYLNRACCRAFGLLNGTQ